MSISNNEATAGEKRRVFEQCGGHRVEFIDGGFTATCSCGLTILLRECEYRFSGWREVPPFAISSLDCSGVFEPAGEKTYGVNSPAWPKVAVDSYGREWRQNYDGGHWRRCDGEFARQHGPAPAYGCDAGEAEIAAERWSLIKIGFDGQGMYSSELPGNSEQLENHFTCPQCGGHHFGRLTAGDVDGNVVVLETVSCHDQREVGCKWRGVWPLNDRSPKIHHELAALRSERDALRAEVERLKEDLYFYKAGAEEEAHAGDEARNANAELRAKLEQAERRAAAYSQSATQGEAESKSLLRMAFELCDAVGLPRETSALKLCDEVCSRICQLEQAEASSGAMRKALIEWGNWCHRDIENLGKPILEAVIVNGRCDICCCIGGHHEDCEVVATVKALSSTAGRELLDKMKGMEAELEDIREAIQEITSPFDNDMSPAEFIRYQWGKERQAFMDVDVGQGDRL